MSDDNASSSSLSLPPAMHPPDPAIAGLIRDVRPGDGDLLHAECWSHRTLTRCRALVHRILDAQQQHKGVGVVIQSPQNTDRLIGYGQLRRWTRCGEVSDLIVAASQRGQGYGTALIQYLVGQRHRLDDFTCLEIGAAISNPRALQLYRRLGFRESYTINLRVDGQVTPVLYLRLYPSAYSDENPDV